MSRRGDTEAAGLASVLRRIGVPCVRIDADGLDSLVLTVDAGSGTVAVSGSRFVPTVTWVRHFSPRAAPGPPGPAAAMLHRDSWAALALQLSTVSGAVVGGPCPGQLEQLARAAAAGVRTPRTLVTTDPAAAAEDLPCDRYVVKALDRHFVEPEPGVLAWFLPQVVERARLAEVSGFAGAPVVLQEHVPHDAELRVYVVGGETVAFDVAKEAPGDIWSHPERVGVRLVEPPAPVADAARALAGEWGLTYGAFDFLVDGREPVFLEVNGHGDWHWFERRAGVGAVGEAVARTVRDLHRSLVPEGGPGTRGVGLLAFLGAARGAAA